MSEQKTWVIPTNELQIGTTLSFDLMDASGNVLHKAGTPINERLKERLQKKNIHSVTVRGESPISSEVVESIMLSSYSAETVRAIQASISSTHRSLCHLIETIRTNGVADSEALSANVHLFVERASQDVSAMLGVISLRNRFSDQAIVDRLAERSTKSSMLGVIMSLASGQTVEAAAEVGLAGLLHDASLLSHPEWFLNSTPHDDKYLAEYRRHPIESAELLNGIEGISRNTILIITQVHEQADGTGYPRGLKIEQTLKGASILNLADAYLALTTPLQGKQLAPADAMAYLCYQTALGKFSKESLQHFLQNMSIYPIGSTVKLDDETSAVVVEGGTGKPLQPVVRLLGTGNLRIDLSASSRFISGPYMVGEQGTVERIQKQQMQQVLWRTDY
jgi:hypothetical protein